MSVSSSSNDPTQVVVDILSGFTGWTNATPEVHRMNEKTQTYRESNPDPALYVWSPTGGDIRRFSADGDQMRQIQRVEVDVWTLDSSDTFDYFEDVIDLFDDYLNDQEQNTVFHRVEPTNSEDFRPQKRADKTDHYIMTVEIQTRRLRDT